jgi:SAM-dependent methyltransferase
MTEGPKARPGTVAPRRTPASSFEPKYRELGDPWHFRTSYYEQRRYDIAVTVLPAPRYRRVFEPGCAIGELTARLAGRADAVVAMDCSPTAVQLARARCRGFDHVTVVVGELPTAWPDGIFDLIVLSEIGYYFDRVELGDLASRSLAALVPGGTLLALHWRGESEDHVLRGDEVHAVIQGVAVAHGARRAGHYCEDAFRADLWTRAER